MSPQPLINKNLSLSSTVSLTAEIEIRNVSESQHYVDIQRIEFVSRIVLLHHDKHAKFRLERSSLNFFQVAFSTA